MKLWRLEANTEKFPYLVPKDYESARGTVARFLKGEKIEETLPTIEVKFSRKARPSNFPHLLTGIPVFTREASSALSRFLENHVQLFPLSHPDYELYAANVYNVVDCLDLQKSDLDMTSSGVIVKAKKYEFKPEKIQGQFIFKIPQWLHGDVFVTDEFKEFVLASGLNGFNFVEVWDSGDSHEAKEERYPAQLRRIEAEKGTEYDYLYARELVEQGKMVASAQWRIVKNSQGEVLIGQLKEDGEYTYMLPYFFPPIFDEMKWHVVKDWPKAP